MPLKLYNKKYWIFTALIGLIVFSCRKDQEDQYAYDIPTFFPEMFIPEDNAPNELRVELGRHLFFDKGLSRDNTISCGSCHIPEKAFADNNEIAIGIENREGIRNSPTLTNVAYHTSFFMDGGVPSLELQVLAPIEAHAEMDFNIVEAAEKLSSNHQYQQWSTKSYNRELDPYVIMRSIAAFERSLLSFNSPFDQFYYQGNQSAISESAKKGWKLFRQKEISCIQCHKPPLFTNSGFHHIGLDSTDDEGRRRITGEDRDLGKFKTPTLRNLKYTYPYMHDGRFETLEEVIEHFNSGGIEHDNKSKHIKPLNLTEEEKQNIIAFLNSLNDDSFTIKETFQNPFK